MNELPDVYDDIPSQGPNPFDKPRRPRRSRKRVLVTAWAGLLAAAAVFSAVLGWTPFGGGQLLIAKLLFVLFAVMSATALIGRLVVDPA
jgi:hypothetical protein